MRQIHPALRLSVLFLAASLAWACPLNAASSPAAASGLVVKEIDIVHFSHTDVGFTDSPSVCRELYRRYLDIAVDTILDSMKGPAEKRFFGTAEATMSGSTTWW